MKVKNLTMLEQEKRFEDDLLYGEYLRKNHTPPSESEIGNIEKVFCKARILKVHKHFHPINNLYFQPLQGA